MNPNTNTYDPAVVRGGAAASHAAPVTPRSALSRTLRLGAGVALAGVPTLGLVRAAYAQSSDAAAAVDILNFALTAEYLDGLYYNHGLSVSGLIPSDDRPMWEQINQNEASQREVLQGAIEDLGGTPVSFTYEQFNYEALGFDPFSDYALFVALAQGFEDLGQRAYKGQAAMPAIMSRDALLETALQIHSVEARHASAIRRLRDARGFAELEGWIEQDNGGLPQAAAIYQGESTTTQAGVNLAAVTSGIDSSTLAAAFDEPLTMEQVLNIAGPFLPS